MVAVMEMPVDIDIIAVVSDWLMGEYDGFTEEIQGYSIGHKIPPMPQIPRRTFLVVIAPD